MEVSSAAISYKITLIGSTNTCGAFLEGVIRFWRIKHSVFVVQLRRQKKPSNTPRVTCMRYMYSFCNAFHSYTEENRHDAKIKPYDVFRKQEVKTV